MKTALRSLSIVLSLILISLFAPAQTTFNYTGTIQNYVVPAGVTAITIDAYGAQGGSGTLYGCGCSLTGGKGAEMKGTVAVTPGETIKILVGQMGGSSGGPHGNENGGGGGSFVVRQTGTVPLVIAGGGGGAPSTAYGTSCARNAADANGQTTTTGVTVGCSGITGAGGTPGNGGSAAGAYEGGAGGGFNTAGANGGTHCSTAFGGQSFINGGAGGAGNTCYDTRNYGGFGGGGGGQLSGPGGGGGYSGGGTAGNWSSYSTYGGGGGSYNIGTNQTNVSGTNTGDGKIIITPAIVSFTLNNAGLSSSISAAAAYSLRKLSTSYTGAALNARRSTDNAQADIAFDANGTISNSSVATITAAGTSGLTVGATMPFNTFYGSGNAQVTIYYDQSGNGRNATQGTANSQPFIVLAGAITTLNGKPALLFNGGPTLNVPFSSTLINAQGTFSAVQQQPGLQSGYQAVVSWSSSSSLFGPGFGPLDAAGKFGLYTTFGSASYVNAGPVAANIPYVIEATWTGSGASVTTTRNGGTAVTGALTNLLTANIANGTIGVDNGSTYGGYLSELIILPSALSTTDRQTLEANQMAYYITPTIASFTPTTANTGQAVTITGTNLTGATAVSFGGTAATSFTVVNSTTITAVVAAGAAGNVVVTTPGGSATLGGFSFGTPATALNFNGVNNYVNINNTLGNVGSGDFTIEMNIRTSLANTYFFSKRAACGDDNFISMQAVNGKLSMEIDEGNGAVQYLSLTGNTTINNNAWHHIAVTRKSGLVSIYVDGALETTGTSTANINNNYTTTLGYSVCTNQNGSLYFAGDMDELRVWSRAVCQTELAANKGCGAATTGQTGLVALYHFDQGFVNQSNSGVTSLTDNTGNGNNGTLVNFALSGTTSNWVAGTVSGTCSAFTVPTAAITGTTTVCTGTTTTLANSISGGVWTSSNTAVATINSSGVVSPVSAGTTTITYTNTCGGVSTATVTVNSVATPTIYASGATTFCAGGSVNLNVSALGNAMQMNGTQYGQSNNPALPVGNASRTIEAWVKTTTSTNGVIANWGQPFTNQRSGLIIVGSRIYFVGENNDLQGNINISDGNWHHVAVTFDGTTVSLYVDGVLDISSTKSLNTTGTTLRIGQRSIGDAGSELYNGIMDELRIWNVARTPAQLLANRFAEIPGNTAGLVAYYKLNETSGLSLTDASVNNVTSTLTAAVNWIPSNAPGSFSSYAWSPGGATTASITATASGNYTVTVTANGCTASSTPTAVTVNPLPTATISGTALLYQNSAAPNITFTGANGTAPYTFTYTINGGSQQTVLSSGNTATVSVPTTTAGTFTYALVSVKDASATLCTASVSGSATVTVNQTPPGNALGFDATLPTKVTINQTASVTNLGLSGFTLEAWAYYTSTSGVYSIIRKDGDYNLFILNGVIGAEVWTAGTSSSAWTQTLGTTVLPLNRWVHITAAWDHTAGSFKLYVNGVLETTTNTTPGTQNVIDNLTIGYSPIFGQGFTGKLDEIHIWNTPRTQAQIQSDMTTVSTVPQANLVAYYNFDEGVAGAINTGINTLIDLSGNNNNGTLNAQFALNGTATNWVESYAMVVPTATAATTITGTGFTANWTAPAVGTVTNYLLDVSTSSTFASAITGSPFTIASPTLTKSVTGLTAGATYFYRVRADKASVTGQGAYSNAITLTEPGITAGSVTGTILACAGNASTSPNVQQFNVTGSNLLANITATAPAGFEISTVAGSGYSNTVTLTPTGGTVSSTTIFVRSAAGDPSGTISGNVVLVSSSVTVNVAVSGTVNALPTATISGATNVCQNSASPTITFTGANGTPPYTFTYQINSVTQPTVVSTGNIATVTVPTGTVINYTYGLVSVKDASASTCSNTASGSAVVTVRLIPVISSVTGNTTICSGAATTLTAASSNAASPTFRWYDAASGGTLLFTGAAYTTPVLTANATYYVEVSDIPVSCTSPTRTVVTVTVNTIPTASIAKTDVSCSGGSDGTITVTAANGTAPYQYSKDGGATYQSSNIFSGLAAGSYTVVVKSATTCVSASQPLTIGTAPDVTKPVPNIATLPVLTGECSVTVSTIPTATDNCVGNVTGTTTDPLSYNSQGTYTITWSYNDGHGNIQTQTQTVIVKDITPPVLVCAPNQSVLNTAGQCSAQVVVISPSVSDNCSGYANNNALDFDGQDDFVTIGNQLASNSSYTKEAWVYTKSTNPSGNIISADDYPFWIENNQLSASNSFQHGGQTIRDPNQFPVAQWTHVAVTYDAPTHTMKLYKNGIVINSSTTASTYLSGVLTLGQYQGSNFLNSVMDEVRVWNVARTSAEINANMNIALTGSPAGLVSRYSFDQGVAGGSNAGVTTLTNTQGNTAFNGSLTNFALSGASSNWVSGAPALSGLVLNNNFNNTSNASGLYPVGSTNVVWTVTDAAGNTSTCTQVITVTAPDINLTGNGVTIVKGDVVPSTTDNTDFGGTFPSTPVTKAYTIQNTGTAPLTVSSINISGTNAANFTVGGISFPAIIAAGGSATFSLTFNATAVGVKTATVTVNSNDCDEASYNFAVTAQITCTTPVFANINPHVSGFTTTSTCNSAISYALSASGTPTPSLTYTFTGATTGSGSGTGSGQIFNKGVTNVTVSATNACATVTNSFDVTVTDNIVPTITAPAAITVTNDAGKCGATINLGTPVTNDNCGVASVTNNGASFTSSGLYPIGVTTVTWTVTDNSGLTATATQIVTVKSPEINITGNGVSIVKGDVTPSSSDNTDFGGTLPATPISKTFTIQNTGTSALTVSSINVSGTNAAEFTVSGISFPATIAASGSTTFTVTFNSGTVGFRTATVTVNNNDCDEASYDFAVKAQVTCTAPFFANTNVYIQSSTSATSCDAVVTYPLSVGGSPAPAVTYTFTGATTGTGSGTGSGQKYNQGITHVLVSATNPCGTVTTAFDITVVDDVKPVVVSKNITIYLDQTGHATFNVNDLNNGSHDNCGPVTVSLNSGTICGTAAEGSNVNLQAPAGTVIDNIQFASYGTPNGVCGNFTIGNCHAYNSGDIVSNMAIGQNAVSIPAVNGLFGDPCGGTVKRLYIQATYGYGGDATNGSFTCRNLGANTVTFIVTDAAGNASTGTAIVTVVDRQGPTINAPGVNVNTNSAQCGIVVNNYNVTATDCTPGTNTLVYSIQPGTFFNIGTTPVTVTATDVLGNVSTATFNVNVYDGAGPVIAVPADITVNNDHGQCGAVVSFAATATDCSGVGSINYNYQPGTSFPIGRTQVTVTAYDVLGNQSTAYFNVTVLDNEPPVITNVPANITLQNDKDSCGAVVNYSMPVVVDNCGGQTSSQVFSFSGSQQSFTVPLGVTSITVDMSGAGGGAQYGYSAGANGGRVQATIPVTPGQVLLINVGGAGQNSDYNYGAGAGGYNGGGNGGSNNDDYYYYGQYYDAGAGGGGASDIRTGAGGLNDRIAVAGGGGGASGYSYSPGYGGGLIGADAYNYYGTNSGGGTQTSGGAGSAYYYDYINGNDGGFGNGGNGADRSMSGGGGGGWYGGGGGAWSDGGGGSSYTIESATNVTHTQGFQYGDGVITITWATPVTLVQTAGLPSGATFPVGTTTNTFTATDVAGNASSVSFDVTITDTQKPVLTVPANIAVNNDPDKCGATINITPASATDNCSIASIVGVRSDAQALTADYPIGSTTITWTATDIHNNTSIRTQAVTVADNQPPVITCSSNITAIATSASGAVVNYTAPLAHDNCSVIVARTAGLASGSTFPIGTTVVTYTATDAAGLTASCSFNVVVSGLAPVINCPANIVVSSSANACGANVNYAATETTAIPASTITYSITPGSFFPVGTTAVTATATNAVGVSICSFTVTVVDDVVPTVITKNITIQLDAAGNASITPAMIDNGSSDNCSIATYNLDKTSFDCSNTGANTVTLTVTDIHNNVSTATAVVTVQDNVAPIVITKNITVQLDANGAVSITPADVNNGSTDNCSIATYSLDKTSFNCSNVGNNTVTLTVTDVNGNVSTAPAVVTVQDNVAPIVITQNITVQLDANGHAVITPANIDNGSTDNCSIATYSLDKASFDCSNVGNNTVVLTVTDVNGNVSTGTAVVTVQDNVAPVVITKNITVQLDANGAVSITPADVNNGSTDNCSIATYSLDKTSFDCSNVGNNTVVLTVTDVNGNVSTAPAVVTVQDNVAPVVITKNITVQLDANGAVSITPADVNNGSTDNCSIATYSLDKTSFNCSNVGANTVTLTVTDVNGNVSTGTAVVTVQDKVAPIVITQNITVQLDANGHAVITPANIDNGSTDNCSIATYSLDKTSFDCSNVGNNTVVLTVRDVNGNVSTGIAVVTVQDNVAPVVITKNITVQLDANGAVNITPADVNNGSTDNCSIATYSLDKTGFDCSNTGANTVTLTVTDVNGNVSTGTAVVTVQDNVAPVVITRNITVQLDANGHATITPADINNGSTDNCAIAGYSLDKTSFDCSNVGNNTVVLTVTDVNGNVSTGTAVVTVQDNVAPTVITKSITVQLDANGAVSITPADVNNGSTDNCTIATYSLDKTSFNCSNVGANTVTLTVTDVNGNVSSNTAVVTVKDLVPAVVLTKNITIQLSTTGTASITVADINNGSHDACGIASMVLSKTSFDCSNVGANTVTLTVTDVNGNVSSNTAVVTVKDLVPAVVITKNITIQLNASGSATIAAADVNNGSNDACGIASMVVSPNVFGCSNVGVNTVTLTVTDVNGNVSSKTAVVTVQDKVAPVVLTKNITVNLDGTGHVSIAAGDVNNGSSDACGIASMSVSPNSFDCSKQGANTVTLTVTDVNGNTSTKTAIVTVQDKLGPVPTVLNLPTVTGQCSANVVIVSSTCSDNCRCCRAGCHCHDNCRCHRNDNSWNNWSWNSWWWNNDDDDDDCDNDADDYNTYYMTTPTALDNCSGLIKGTTTDPMHYNTQGTYTINWKFTDANGNVTIQPQTVIVHDDQAPIPWVSSLPTISGQCSVNLGSYDNDWWDDDDDDDYNLATPWAWDNCAGWIRGTTTSPLSYSSQGTYTIVWKFNDGHGNITIENQTVIVKDNIAPRPMVANLPTVTGSCSATVTTVPTAKDNCVGIVNGTTTSPLSYNTQGTYTIVWTYNDGHGNTSTQTQKVVIDDDIKPVPQVSNLPTLTGECSVTVSTVPKANDNCKGMITGTTTDPLTYSSEGTYTIHWSYNDGNGNITIQNQTVIINDVTAPVPQVATLPTLTGECSVTVSTIPKANDNCKGVITATTSDALTYTKQGTYTIHWTYNDGNGNTSTQNQTVVVNDVTKPVITAPAAATVSCGTSTAPTVNATATDNCSTPTVTYTDVTAGNTITRTWKATDAAGNYSTATQTLTIVDNTAPVITDPKDVTVSCGTSTLPSVTGQATATDACSTPTVSYTDVTSGNTITRTWKAKDAAGNSSTSTQVITIVDNTKPVITDIADVTVNCGASTDPSVTGRPTASDNCSSVTITSSDVTSGNVITRTWKAMDASGNYATSVQVITIGMPFTTSVSSVPTSSTYTGGVSTNLYLGYGAQSTTLQVAGLPASGAPYSYAWSGTYTSKLSSTTGAAPVFTPSTFGYYTFNVTVTNKYGCTASCSISICVTDVRVPGTNGAKIYVTHTPNGKNAVAQTLQVLLSQVSAHIGSNSCGGNGNDRLGSTDQSPCNTTIVNATEGGKTATAKDGETVNSAGTEEDLKVTAMPNPTTTFFTLKIESRYQTPVELRVMDARGRVVDAKSKIGANSTIQIGHNYSSGTYYAELIQGTQRKVVQLIKGRG